MTTTRHGIFEFVDPPDAVALQQCIDAHDACFFPWAKCVPELEAESGGVVRVAWEDTGQGNTGYYVAGSQNHIYLNDRYAGVNYAFTFLHECGHMVDDTWLRDEQRRALVDKWHTDLDGRWDGYYSNGIESEWSHNQEHWHYNDIGWGVSGATYYHKPNEAFADLFVAAFAPSYFPYKRFAHWSDDILGCKDIILSEPEPPEPESPFKDSKFPNDPIYRLYRAYFLREPDQGGYDYWVGLLSQGYPLASISQVFAGSAEFAAMYGSLGNWGFVKLVYRNVLGREPDTEGLHYWVDQLNRGLPRGHLMVHFSESKEFIDKINAERR